MHPIKNTRKNQNQAKLNRVHLTVNCSNNSRKLAVYFVLDVADVFEKLD
jgi:hypothetical protein